MNHVKYLIIGAGPTGLGAAWRLEELGEHDWLLVDRAQDAGGLAGSVIEAKGYTWDLGGHVQFSHYDKFDELMASLLAPEEWLRHERESWVRIQGRFVPYPFQKNLRYLPRETMWDCVRGLLDLRNGPRETRPANFGEWMRRIFGEGICRHFMEPYNFKVWAWPLDQMAYDWIGDRVAVTDVESVLKNILLELDDVSWGPNQTFKFPLRGGTGEIWRRLAARLPAERMRFDATVERVETGEKTVRFASGAEPIQFDHLISTIPLDLLVKMSDLGNEEDAARHASALCHSATHIVGLGVAGVPADDVASKCWMYFPEGSSPFYRATVFSNYSPNNVPDIKAGWSLMCETSESGHKPVDGATIVDETIEGCIATGLIADRADVVHTFYQRLPYGYPTPTLGRDAALDYLLPKLDERGVHSRGRFGAWRYEVSNQDHSLMQGVECVEWLVSGEPERTIRDPEAVNAPRPANPAAPSKQAKP